MEEGNPNNIYENYYAFRKDYPLRIAQMKNDLGKKMANTYFVYMSLPFTTRIFCSWILNELQRSGGDITPYLKDLEPLDRDVDVFVGQNLETYIIHIEDMLRLAIATLHPETVGDDGADLFEAKIGKRTHIEFLMNELGKYRDVTTYREQVAKLDEEFKKRIPEAVRQKTYLPNDFEWAPKEYWWLHLEEQYGYPDEFVN